MSTKSNQTYFQVDLSVNDIMETSIIDSPQHIIETLTQLSKTDPDTVKNILGYVSKSLNNPTWGYNIEENLSALRGMDTTKMEGLGKIFELLGYVTKIYSAAKVIENPDLTTDAKAMELAKIGYEQIGSLILDAIPPFSVLVNIPGIGPIIEFGMLEGGRLIGDNVSVFSDNIVNWVVTGGADKVVDFVMTGKIDKAIDTTMTKIGVKDLLLDTKVKAENEVKKVVSQIKANKDTKKKNKQSAATQKATETAILAGQNAIPKKEPGANQSMPGQNQSISIQKPVTYIPRQNLRQAVQQTDNPASAQLNKIKGHQIFTYTPGQ